jgi:hypothetical protein
LGKATPFAAWRETMSTEFRIHLSVLLLAVLASVLLFAFGMLERAQLLPLSAALYVFGGITLLVNRFYQTVSRRSSRSTH